MARWRLTNAHYLNVPGTEYEHVETDRTTGKRLRKIYKVPLLLDPKEPGDCNYPDEIIVAHEGKGERRDIFFEGPPTPDMEALDEEAEEISRKESANWLHPIDSLASHGDFGQGLIQVFQKQLDAIVAKVGIPKGDAIPNQALDSGVLAQMQAQMNELMAKNAQLEAKMVQMEHAEDDTDINAPVPPAPTVTPTVGRRA